MISLVFALAIGLSSTSVGEDDPPISIMCPCSVENIDQTRDVATFFVIFNKEVSESGDFRLDFNLKDSPWASRYWPLSRVPMSSIPYSNGSQLQSVILPRKRKSPIDEGYLDLALVFNDSIFDQVVMNYDPIQYGDYSGSYSADDPFTFESSVNFEYESTTFSLQIDKVRNSLLKNTDESLIVKVVASDFATYFTKFSSDINITYDSEGVGSIEISDFLDYTVDSHVAHYPGHTRLQLKLFRGDTLLVEYALKAIGDGVMPSFDLSLTNVDTLVDADGDGISDFNETLIGTSSSEVTSMTPTPIEIVFTYGSAAYNYLGAELSARVAHTTAVANTAFFTSGVDVTVENIGEYSVGDDTALDADLVLSGITNREGIFSNIDDLLERKPDLFIHLSTIDVLGTGGKASLQGSRRDGLINHGSLYSKGTNRGAVSVDNSATTLAHEIGHLMGLAHSRRQADGNPSGTFPWSLGHGVDDDFATIMAYRTEFGSASGLEFFSSPSIICGDSSLPCGVDRNDYLAGADSVLTLETTMHQIAAISNGFPPSISLIGGKTINLTVGASFSEPGFVVIDKEDGILTSSVSVTGVVNTETAGTYTVTYRITDSDQNTVTLTRIVIVEPDLDGDGISDDSDDDRDGDGYINVADIFPDDSSEWYDSDADGVGDNTDDIYDPASSVNRSLVNRMDACSSDYEQSLLVIEIDGIAYPALMPGDRFNIVVAAGRHVVRYILDGAVVDETIRWMTIEEGFNGWGCFWDEDFDLSSYILRSDSDGDGILDYLDAFPQDTTENLDSDSDGVGNNADIDDDNDGYSDSHELAEGTDPFDANSAPIRGLNLMIIKAAVDIEKARDEVEE
ncbi:DUF5011 domain-containing protein [Porticoccaceae bacterium]|nr:DUF5011 domain-containing protein [Porticoccaceae bacterium]